MTAKKVAWGSLGLVVLVVVAAWGDSGRRGVNTTAAVLANDSSQAAEVQPTIPPEEGGDPSSSTPPEQPTIPPEEGGDPFTAPGRPTTIAPFAPDTGAPASAEPAPAPMPPQGSGVYGRVTGAGGGPEVGAAVGALSPDRPSDSLAAVTDAKGNYTWSLAPGTWQITVSEPNHRSITRAVVVRAGAASRIDIELERR